MKIIDRYMLKQLFFPYIFGMMGFMVILSINPLVEAMFFVINRNLPALSVMKWFLYRLPQDMGYTFPMAMLFSALMIFSRMSKDSEVVAFKSGGVSIYRMMTPVLIFALFVSIFALLFSEFVAPLATERAQKLKHREFLKINEPRYKEKVLVKDSATRILFMGKIDVNGGTVDRFMLMEVDQTKPYMLVRRIAAARAFYEHGVWRLADTVEYEYDESGWATVVSRVSYRTVKLNHVIEDFRKVEKKTDEMSMRELKAYINMCNRTGTKRTIPLLVDFYLKGSIPFASFIFAILGTAMGLRHIRGGAFIGFGISTVVVFVYYVAMSFARSYGRVEILPPLAAAWLHNIIFGFVGFYFVSRLKS